ncbi:MAG: VWA domain-containing protein [Myxococcales bacterium]|nr:VWA domain-containing protein [Myxococcales bacterium]
MKPRARETTMPSNRPSMSAPSKLFASLALLALGACGSTSDGAALPREGGPGTRLAPGGAQDFGLFRDIVESGGIPTPETLDATGFFAEHAIGVPDATCGDALCAEASFGVMGNLLNGQACTLVRVSLATPLTAPEPDPAHLVVLVDTSRHAATSRESVIEPGLVALFEGLSEGDRVSLVAFAGEATTLAEAASAPTEPLAALAAQPFGGDRDLYAGMRAAYALAARTEEGVEPRVLVLTSGGTDLGITSPARLASLVTAQAAEGIATTVVGFGDADPVLWARLSATGAGNSYFIGGAADAREVFREELATSFTPLARDVRIRLDGGKAWDVVGVYGVSDVVFDPDAGVAAIPNLFIASRRDAGGMVGPGMGRRGGGGAILFELMPRATVPRGTDLHEVGSIGIEFVDPRTGERVFQRADVQSPFAAGVVPDAGLFGDAYVEKAFVALNVLVGFKMMSLSATEGDHRRAISIGRNLELNLVDWLRRRPDTDIEDDLSILRALLANIEARAPSNTDIPNAPPAAQWAWD